MNALHPVIHLLPLFEFLPAPSIIVFSTLQIFQNILHCTSLSQVLEVYRTIPITIISMHYEKML